MVRFTLRQLAYVQAIAETGGIAQAARKLNISQPSVAQGLDKLEAVTGLSLFERHHARGVTLTTQGRRFLEHANGLLKHADQVQRDAEALAAFEAGELRLGCFATIAAFHLPGLIRSFERVCPSVRVSAEEANLEWLAEKVHEGRLDVGLTYDIGNTLDGLDVCPLTAIEPAVLLPSDHPRAERKSIRLRDLADEPYVLYDAPGSRDYFTDLLDRAGLSPRIGYASQTLEGVRSAVAAGFGFSIVALRPRRGTTYGGNNVVALPMTDRIKSLQIVAASRVARHKNPILQRFIDHALQHFESANDPRH